MRTQKLEEALVLCDEVLAAKPTDDATLSAMTLVLRGLGRREFLFKPVSPSTEDALCRYRHDRDVRGGIQTSAA